MIGKQDILDRALEWQLRPDVVEKDYVLGWVLAALAATSFRDHWIFKGGTCIKKCFSETYRFSEDLDFSLTPEAAHTEEAVRENLTNMAQLVAELSGVGAPETEIVVLPRRNLQGQSTLEGRIAYRGPLGIPSNPRVRFDLTWHEPLLDDADSRTVFHPYPDQLPEGMTIRTYSAEELLAEKLRALYERARPRDLYDVVFLLRNQPDAFELHKVRALFARKCAVKRLAVPSTQALVELVTESAELRSEWENMLGHQLPALPDLDTMITELPRLLAWLEQPAARLPGAGLRVAPAGAGEVAVGGPSIRFWGGGAPLEVIRFAGANRLLVEFDYDGKHRAVEPYSLRRAATGNLLLYAWEQGAEHIKAFKVVKISNVRPSQRSFAPRYRVEFSAYGPLFAPASRTAAPRRHRP
jgi:predicted nucleotidyltransferase component of viral defense system